LTSSADGPPEDLDFASFKAADSHPVEGLIDMLRAKAAFVISNEASLSSLYARADEAISLFRKEGQVEN
jgi:hypothetical protein